MRAQKDDIYEFLFTIVNNCNNDFIRNTSKITLHPRRLYNIIYNTIRKQTLQA